MRHKIGRCDFMKGCGLVGLQALGGLSLGAAAKAPASPIEDMNPGEIVVRRPSPLDPTREVSTLGLGGVRLPVLSGKLGSQDDAVDYETATRYVDYSLAHGINWFDTGYFYHNGDSERFYGHALSRHPRESFWFCTKAPWWSIKSLSDAKRIFEDQLARTRFEYFDVYMIHSIMRQEDYEQAFLKTGALDYYREQKAKGRIKHIGFSFHGREDFMDYLLAAGEWDVVTILMNGVDWGGAYRACSLLDKLRKKGIPAVGMESLAGGHLARLRKEAHDLLQSRRPELSDAAWSLRFAAERPGMMTAMTGFTKFEHLKENIHTFSAANYRPLSDEDVDVYLKAIKINSGGGEGVACSGCKYCMPCPYGVDIPQVFHFWNSTLKWGRLPSPSGDADHGARIDFLDKYYKVAGRFRGAERCIGCGRCDKKCPQWQFNIPDELAKIDAYVESLLKSEPDFGLPI